ncbi:MAG: ABC transporter permease [candidate division KSB1 bacterium]|nr:ABC transporter permease [candidate division KSB1 bacterium]MDZ7301770.1 ABC transporter permease [candidate division KSB1 bacterium]MDZ7311451.1 ABC transporter permease [candidate division KSB1 bacterium]
MQQFWESIAIALRALWANKMRSALTILCVIISIMSIIAVVSIVDGMDFYVKTKIADQGSNVFTVRRFNEWEILTDFDKFLKSLKNPNLTLEDLEALREEVSLAEFVDAAIDRQERLNNGRRFVEEVEIRGRTEEYPAIGEFPIANGRHLTRIDVQQRREVCVLGWDVANSLFPDTDPIQQTVKIAGRHYTVVGVCEKKASILGANQNIFAFIPITTHLKHFGSRWRSIAIPIRTASMETFEAAQEQARTVMRIRHKLKPSQEDDFYITTSEQLLSLWAAISTAIFGSLIGIVSITLVVGGIIIMNVMLVAVTERTREIGIRKALGAKRRHIAYQFIIESVTLTIVGGIIGIVLGFTAAATFAALTPLPYRIATWSIAVALIIALVVGLFFGVYPAQKAARLDPVEALRYE